MSHVINEFLRQCVTKVNGGGKNLVAVMGNEGGDMDSIVGSIYLAMYLGKSCRSEMVNAFPVVNFAPEDLPLRGDVFNFFKENGIDTTNLISVQKGRTDQNFLNLRTVMPNIVLYDHNKLMESQRFLAEKVIGVVDHHFDENLYVDQTKSLRIIRTVGSACTLVAELYRKDKMTVPAPQLLMAAIVLDTSNFVPAQKKVTQADIDAYDWLQSLEEDKVDHASLFKKLSAWKKDIMGFTVEQNLKRDYKFFSFECHGHPDKINAGISSIPCSYEKFESNYSQEKIYKSCDSFLIERELDVLILAFAGKVKDEHTRDIAFFALPQHLDRFINYANSDPMGVSFSQRSKFSFGDEKEFIAFSLSDPAVSRKQLAPSLARYLKETNQSALDNASKANNNNKSNKNFPSLSTSTAPMSRGNQRDLAREKNMKKNQERNKGARDDGLSPAQRKEADAERMRRKQAEADAKRNGGQ